MRRCEWGRDGWRRGGGPGAGVKVVRKIRAMLEVVGCGVKSEGACGVF